MTDKLRVLFVCIANDVRSPMAEALLRHADNEHFDAQSAGIRPTALDPRTLEALEHAGVSTDGLRSKSIDEFAGQHFDYLIDLCDKSSDEAELLPHSKEVLVWNFADPAASDRPDAFRHTLQELHERIKMFTVVKNRS
ncbi:arsenate reductase ArsC [Zestomonas carbonaria]|uniref:Arsenate reductase n=1 Tax=Zestomonas carbonaria TaxID=2762745 RepID=A0A7U7EQ63_9GAMM|nr:arsenate reductase ArsC [Pseudomonas carbonaria]CAD5108637.1 Arsenate reductase [Pseudomonas carbonaria]